MLAGPSCPCGTVILTAPFRSHLRSASLESSARWWVAQYWTRLVCKAALSRLSSMSCCSSRSLWCLLSLSRMLWGEKTQHSLFKAKNVICWAWYVSLYCSMKCSRCNRFTKSFVALHFHVLTLFFIFNLFAESIGINAHDTEPGVKDPGLACCLCRPSPLPVSRGAKGRRYINSNT